MLAILDCLFRRDATNLKVSYIEIWNADRFVFEQPTLGVFSFPLCHRTVLVVLCTLIM